MYFDIAAIIFFVLFTLMMKKRGGIKALVSLSGLVLSVIIAMTIYPMLTEAFYKTDIPMNMENTITAVIEEKYGLVSFEALDAMPLFIQNALKGAVLEGAHELTLSMGEAVTKLAINVLMFVLVVVFTKLILALLVKGLDIVVKLPVLKQFNSLTGLLCGCVMSFVIIWLAAMLFGVVSASNEGIRSFTEGSYVIELMSGFVPFKG